MFLYCAVRLSVSSPDRLVVRDVYWDAISDMEDIALEHAEPYEPDLMLNQVDENGEEPEQRVWADAFPEKGRFCQCYLFLRDQYFEGALRGALPELVEHMLDVFLRAGPACLSCGRRFFPKFSNFWRPLKKDSPHSEIQMPAQMTRGSPRGENTCTALSRRPALRAANPAKKTAA